jgi:hypothetical protein
MLRNSYEGRIREIGRKTELLGRAESDSCTNEIK